MRQAFLMLLLAASTFCCYSQQPEFPIYANGLIYDDTTMSRLRFIVDSLNLKFKKCDLFKQYYSVPQTKGYYFTMQGAGIGPALTDIQAGMALREFVKKHTKAVVEDSTGIITETETKDDDNQILTEYRLSSFSGMSAELTVPTGSGDMKVRTKNHVSGRAGKWIYRCYYDAGKWTYLMAFYLFSQPVSVVLPEKYARLILYSDCMIDTSAQVMLSDAGYKDLRREPYKPSAAPAIAAYKEYLQQRIGHLAAKYGIDVRTRDISYQYWYVTGFRKFFTDSISNQPQFRKLLIAAVKEALQKKYILSMIEEDYAAVYYSKKAALAMRRRRTVMGMCGADDRPRVHAMHIALLAAETANWQVFLRAHLNIMNDNFHRASDGSYGWGSRQTYIRELEALDIQVRDLMLGTALRINNPSNNHYGSNVWRLGRAFAETKDRAGLEQQILSMIADKALDDYNRMVLYNLFTDYIFYLPEKSSRIAALDKLEKIRNANVDGIAARFQLDRAVLEKGSGR